MLCRLQGKIETLRTLEANLRNINLTHWQKVIAAFRHRIVHVSGTVPDDFEERIAEKIGRHNLQSLDGNELNTWLKPDGNRRTVWLLDEAALSNGEYDSVIMNFKWLLKTLASHACLLYKKVVEHFGFTPIL
jgi:hypothetical protein